MSSERRAELEQWGFTPQEIDLVLDPLWDGTGNGPKDRLKPIEDAVMERVAEINRLLAPVGLRYDVRQVRAE